MSVKVYYQHREQGPELVNHERELHHFGDACEVIDHYPWARELELFEEHGEGGGFFFLAGDENSRYASYQFTPLEAGKGLLDLEIVLKPGVLGLFGRQAVSVSFELVSIDEAKAQIKKLFDRSLETLYSQHKK